MVFNVNDRVRVKRLKMLPEQLPGKTGTVVDCQQVGSTRVAYSVKIDDVTPSRVFWAEELELLATGGCNGNS